MPNEYTHQILRIVVAQICQTIGWHSIQSTPLELLVDILHKYLQEITRQTYRYTELYGRIEPNLDDVALAFRELNINLPDVEEYINYVDSVNCPIDVPKFPVHKESNLNFLKPGSKEVLTRPVHIYEYLPPIYPEKEVQPDNEQNDTENSCDNIHNSHENGIFKKPEIHSDSPACKKPRLANEAEGRPTREIYSVMMTSSGFISPAREGKLPDAKSPILPETKPISKSPSPLPNSNTTPLPVSSMESKFDKKIKKKSNLLSANISGNNNNNNNNEKERKRDKSAMSGISSSSSGLSKMMNGTSHHHHHHDGSHHISNKQKMLVKKKNKEKKHKDHANISNVLSERSIGNNNSLHLIANNENSKTKSQDLNTANNIKTEHLSQTVMNASSSSNTTATDIDVKPKIDKLSSEPDKQKLNIFKKISSSKKDRDDSSKSPNIYSDNQILPNVPEGTTITPAPPIMKTHSQSSKASDHQSNNVICIDDEQPSMSITKIPPNYSKLPPHQAANLISQNLGALGTTVSKTPRKTRKNKAHQQQQQQQLDQSMPLNLSNPSPINMVKKEILQNSKLPYSAPHKISKGKKERKNKAKQKELKKDSQQQNVLQDLAVRNSLNPLQPMFAGANENLSRANDNLFLPTNKDANSLNQKLGKMDSLLKQGAAPTPASYAASNFPPIPTIPMFPFYPFSARPGLIPSTSLFTPLQPMPDNSSFKPYLPMMRFDFNNVHKGQRLGNKFDDEPPPPPPPAETEKGYCNVAPLVPDSMKFQLSPTRYPSSSTSSTAAASNQKSGTSTALSSSSYDSFGNNGPSVNTLPSHFSEQSQQKQSSSLSSGNANASSSAASRQRSPKFPLDIPIEISDDEKPKSDVDDKPSSKHVMSLDDNNLNSSKMSVNNSSHNNDYPEYSSNKNLKNDKTEISSSPDRSNAVINEREEKHEKRKEKEHKKGKKGKEGKIKKKKDKKDKSKNKDKTGKRKDREEKKDKDKTKKLKKEKKKEKMRALIYSSDDGKQLNDSGDCGAVPKLTLKLGLNNSPQHSSHSSDERKLSLKNERRESSPELARISPLVTRPPKQKNLNEVSNPHPNYDDTHGVTSSSSPLYPPPPLRQSSSDKYQTQHHHQHHHHHHYHQSRNSLLDTTTQSSSMNQQQRLNSINPNNNNNSNYLINSNSSSNNGNGGNIDNHLHNNQNFFNADVVENVTTKVPYLPTITSLASSTNRNNITTTSGNNYNMNSSSSISLESRNLNSTTWNDNNNSTITRTNTNLISIESNRPSSYIDAEGNQVWICPACGRVDDGTPMIGCDGCDAWYHWVCVGIQVPPDENEDWYCRVCIAKKQEAHGNDKKRKRKKKNKSN